MRYLILQTSQFVDWLKNQPYKTQAVIEAQLSRLENDGHWGVINRFDGLVELKWKSGLRVYTANLAGIEILVLLGGNKNGQDKDVKKAKKILQGIIDSI